MVYMDTSPDITDRSAKLALLRRDDVVVAVCPVFTSYDVTLDDCDDLNSNFEDWLNGIVVFGTFGAPGNFILPSCRSTAGIIAFSRYFCIFFPPGMVKGVRSSTI